MGIQLVGNGGLIVGAGEEASQPLHSTRLPFPGNWYSYSGFTGTIGAALAAASEILQFRFLSGAKTYALVQKVSFQGMGIVAVATAVGPVGFELVPARAWTVAGSGGTRIAVSGDNLQLRTSEANSQVNDIGIATTGALTVGTKTLDANAIGGVLGGVGTGAVTIYGPTSIVAPAVLHDADGEGQHPIMLANQEGFVVRTSHVGPTALTYVARFKIIWVEVTDF